MNNFQKEGGGTIRMLGIINELAKIKDSDITLISNIKDRTKVDSSVKHIPISFEFSPKEKRKFQFLLGLFGLKNTNRTYKKQLSILADIFSRMDKNSQFIFFEYLDNSIGYWLKMNRIISGYTNDIHGIASHEFAFQAKKSRSLKSKILFSIKEKISKKLDQKVFNNADGIFYASKAMQEYFYELYPTLKSKKNVYLPYVLNDRNVKPADGNLVKKLKKDLQLQETDFVFLFAGAFKEITGIQDLLLAFNQIANQYQNTKLLLIGDGPTFQDCRKLKESQENADRIYLLGRQPYDHLSSFQEISNVLVCPDRQNLFSELIVHVKYLDALMSGKIVINGQFKSVMEINEIQQLSLLFTPSDIDDLTAKMEDSILNYSRYSEMFKDSKSYTLENLTYKNYIGNLIFN
jgi:glycosyltransferase involved in cell wall biosynthesis